MSDETPRIEERENGPLVAKHIDRMAGSDGREVETDDVMALCRCGQSQDKPFCDGSHRDAGFVSRSEGDGAGPDRIFSYEGADVTVHYNPLICSHAARCIARAPEAFDPDRKPWIKPDLAAPDAIEAAVRDCPSGALRIGGAGGPEHLLPKRAQITVERNGPYWVQGPAIARDVAGEGGTAEKFVLCRCGLSGNKPYCDGSHRDAGWKEADD